MRYLTSQKIRRILTLLLVFLITVVILVLCQQSWVTTILAWQSPEVVYFADTTEPVVALTIDDGPDPVTTPKILDILKQHNVQVTFFLIANNIRGNEGIVDRMVQEGHEIGNHLMIDEPSIKLTDTDFERQLVETDHLLSNFSNVRWFRPASGWYDAEMLAIVHKHNYQTVLGSVHPFDPQIPSAWFATRHILWNVQPGSIIILHDIGTRGDRTATTLTTILPELQRRGYRLVTLSELLNAPK